MDEKVVGRLSIVKSLFIAYGITMIFIIIYSLILAYTGISEDTIPVIMIMINMISVLIASTTLTRKIKEKGLINGAILGLVYIMVTYILSSVFVTGFGMTGYSFITILLNVIAGIVGGIVGVNLK